MMSMLKYAALLAVIINLGSLVHGRVTCNPSMVVDCVKDLQNNDFALATSITNLNTYCQSTVPCLQGLHRSCVSNSRDNSLKDLYKGVNSLIQDVCNKNSDLHEKILKHGGCISRIQSNLLNCQHSFQRSIRKVLSAGQSETNRILCCGYNAFMDCNEKSGKDACGAEAGTLVRTMIARVPDSLLRGKCASYIDGQTKCNE